MYDRPSTLTKVFPCRGLRSEPGLPAEDEGGGRGGGEEVAGGAGGGAQQEGEHQAGGGGEGGHTAGSGALGAWLGLRPLYQHSTFWQATYYCYYY